MSSEKLKAHHHHSDAHRNDLAGEHRLGDTVQLIFLLLFLVVWILDSFMFHYTTFLSESVPWFIRFPAGTVILLIAFGLARSGLRVVFRDERDTPHVITKAVFSYLRHPIYLSAILLYLGLITFTLSLASASLWIIIIAFYWFISRYEEKLLIQMYGDEYRKYMKKVPMLLPLKFRR